MPDVERRTLHVHGEPIDYAVIRSRRRRRTLEISVHPVDGVRVAVLARTSRGRIEEFVASRAGWIRRRRADWAGIEQHPRNYRL